MKGKVRNPGHIPENIPLVYTREARTTDKTWFMISDLFSFSSATSKAGLPSFLVSPFSADL